MKELKQISKLRHQTFNLLRNRPASITLDQIANEAGLSKTWVKSFHIRGDKRSASVDNVATLYEYLTGKSLV
jgi:hypothetical protein